MELHNMKPTPGSRSKKKRVGRGDKTAGRGENGQKSRAGYSKKIGFEGGQNPLYLRLPKRGFNNVNRKEYDVLNIGELNELNFSEINLETLKKAKVIKNSVKLLKILGDGELTKAINVKAGKVSQTAKEAIEKAGGTVIETDR
ncbi:MAG: 50S ribosomal protein L15 [Mycoplasmataceae bacterium]|nr:50S ribosomal protein L15 [Mycoplasmataceae bacterium]